MYCNNCGNKFKDIDKFCGCCGTPRNAVEHFESAENEPIIPASTHSTQEITPSEKKGLPVWGTLLICLGILIAVVIVVVIVAFVCLSFVVMDVNETLEYDDIYEQRSYYVYLYEDSVPSLYNLIGEYSMCDSPDYGNENILYYYCDSKIDDFVLDEYLDILVSEYGYKEFTLDDDSRSVMIQSSTDGYSIIVDVNYDYDSIEYKRIKDESLIEDSYM